MAGKTGGKGRKIGRWKKSPSMMGYKAQNRRLKNKMRKMKKHADANPNDKHVDAAIRNHGGKVPDFPHKPVVEQAEREVYDQPIKVDFRKADRLFRVVAQGSVEIERSPNRKDAQKAFDECGTDAVLYMVQGQRNICLLWKQSPKRIRNSSYQVEQ
jgi:hypothetical protein